jgi:uncharacterized protein (TIGR03790 family)
LQSRGLTEQILYIVTTSGVPLRVKGREGLSGDVGSVDSELTLLYSKLKGRQFPVNGTVPNPYFKQKELSFGHPRFPIYLVTRLTGYDFSDIRALVDRCLHATNTGKVVIDMRGSGDSGDYSLRRAAMTLPRERVVLDDGDGPIYDVKGVIGYASWGSNDPARQRRKPGFEWLPGAIMTEFVSYNGRTFARPPDEWKISTWKDRRLWFAGAPQTLAADYINEGASGAAGNVAEPFLTLTVQPDILLPQYLSGRNLAESYWMATPALSWQNMVVGDPLCSLGRPK